MTRSRLTKLRDHRRRRAARLRIVRTGRSPHEILVCITALLIGGSGLVLPTSISPAIDEAFPDSLDNVYFAGLVLSSILTLLGIMWYRVEGLLLERIGLVVQACLFASYGIAILSSRGLEALAFALIPVCFTVANLVRAWQIRADLANLPAVLATGGPPERGSADDGR